MSQINKELKKTNLRKKIIKCWYGFWERLGKLISPVYLKAQDRRYKHYKNIDNYNLNRIARKAYSKLCHMLVVNTLDEKIYFVRNTEYMNNGQDSDTVNIYTLIDAINSKEAKNFIRYFWRKEPISEVEEILINLIQEDISLKTKVVNIKDIGITIFSESYVCLKDKIILEISVDRNVI